MAFPNLFTYKNRYFSWTWGIASPSNLFFFFLSTDPPRHLLSSSCYWFIVFYIFLSLLLFSCTFYPTTRISIHILYGNRYWTWGIASLFNYYFFTDPPQHLFSFSCYLFIALFLYFTLFLAYYSCGHYF